jgi:hypothetical protein
MRCIIVILIAVWLQFGAAQAQTRVVVVPAGTDVVVPARGSSLPAASRRRVARARVARPPVGEALGGGGALGGGSGLAVPFLALLPLAAAAALASTLPGGGSGTSSPARTR